MSFCSENDEFAIVTLFKDGRSFEVKISSPPITINCKDNNYERCTLVSVNAELTQRNLNTGVVVTDNYSYQLRAPIMGIKTRDEGAVVEIFAHGNSFSGCLEDGQWFTVATGGGNWRFVEARILSITPVDRQPLPDKKGVVIRDKNNVIVFDDNTVDCNWDVRCDEDCPKGTKKIKINSYPGYCCLDCKAIANEISSMTNTVRNLNNG